MNYDDWKLMSPDYSEEVSECCGAETSEETIEEEDVILCDSCGEECVLIDEEEYKYNRWESYQEDLADERRHEDR